MTQKLDRQFIAPDGFTDYEYFLYMRWSTNMYSIENNGQFTPFYVMLFDEVVKFARALGL